MPKASELIVLPRPACLANLRQTEIGCWTEFLAALRMALAILVWFRPVIEARTVNGVQLNATVALFMNWIFEVILFS